MKDKFNGKDFGYPIPEIGDEIYVGTSLFLSLGILDFNGGKAIISMVKEGISAGEPTIYISVKENPGTKYNWEFLYANQEEHKERFGDDVAHSDPDYRKEFNDPRDYNPDYNKDAHEVKNKTL